jgi:hypothetical protein
MLTIYNYGKFKKWINVWNSSKSFQTSIRYAAKRFGIEVSELFVIIMGEGEFIKEYYDSLTKTYFVPPPSINPDYVQSFPIGGIDGFVSLGLDTFADDYTRMVAAGIVATGEINFTSKFHGRTEDTDDQVNGRWLKTGVFPTLQDAVLAVAAYYKYQGHVLSQNSYEYTFWTPPVAPALIPSVSTLQNVTKKVYTDRDPLNSSIDRLKTDVDKRIYSWYSYYNANPIKGDANDNFEDFDLGADFSNSSKPVYAFDFAKIYPGLDSAKNLFTKYLGPKAYKRAASAFYYKKIGVK